MEVCKDLRETYEVCFNIWFSEKFLKGNHNESMCASLLKNYTDCVKNAMKEQKIELKEMEKNHLEEKNEDKSES
ncbi:TP53-regulated inhibitor of apoptosis 1-like isoform X2 [Leptopilina boulardi]|uniref:TP53-regulated inhibitor of apoptosis 1-like isoform X2 n=1 Tax=Leptopilina boulardi TaxID=63433 RepID=UPI0021F518FC|nr:TP53-regulated inhibitor of apoptosis 1-like isoform X2 [Leptopilina boulardi]